MDLHSFFEFVLDFLYPPACVACARDGEWWCVGCRKSVESSFSDPEPPEGIQALVVTGFYHDPCLRAAIHALKYAGLTRIQKEIGEYLGDFAAHRSFPWPKDVAVQPVPTSKSRVRSRGFDQAMIIADLLSSNRVDLLERNGAKIAQATLESPELRAMNAKGTFTIKSNQVIPKNILLVDDVVTSGSTMGEAARVLRENGAEHIFGFAIALGK